MASPRPWKGQLVLGLGLVSLSLAICLGFLVFGHHYWGGGSGSLALTPSPVPDTAHQATQLPIEPSSAVDSPPVRASAPSAQGSLPQLWLVTFLTVFVAEMGDKTQLATLLMSAQSRSPWAIFFGSSSALVTASLLSVLLGGSLGQVIPAGWLQWLAGAGFLVIGSYVLWQEWQGNSLPEG